MTEADEDSGHIPRSTYRFLNLAAQFLSGMDCTWHRPWSAILTHTHTGIQIRELDLHIFDQSIIEDNFWAPNHALHNWIKAACKDAHWRANLPAVHFSVFEENSGNHSHYLVLKIRRGPWVIKRSPNNVQGMVTKYKNLILRFSTTVHLKGKVVSLKPNYRGRPNCLKAWPAHHGTSSN
jgi:hypothetical protein